MGAAASARQTDNQQPIEITGCSYTQEGSTVVFAGCFSLTQGSRQIDATQATVVQHDDQTFQRIELVGQPATWRETGEDGQPFDARARDIAYDVQAQLITLRGDVEVRQGERLISSQTMRYNLRTGRVEGGDANDPNSRVRLVFPPPDASENPTEEPRDDGSN